MPINPESKDPANKLENQKTEQFKPGQILDEGETMEKPEQQATPQPEKIQDGADLDIDAAKKYLDEVYGREKSGAGKVKPLVQKEEQKPKFFVPEEIGQKRTQEQVEEYKKIREEGQKIVEKKKEIGKRESLAEEKRKKEDMPSALDLAYERAKKISQETTNEGENKPEAEVKEGPIIIGEVEKKQQQELAEKVETAKNELIDLSKKIAENREAVYNAINSELGEKEKIKTEMSLYDKAKEVFEIATGESLEKTAKERTKIEVENEGLRIVTIKEYREKKTAETQERIRQKGRSAVIRERWDMLSDKEKEKYFIGAKDKNDSANIDSARMKFAIELKGKIDAKKQELSNSKKGIIISEDAFYELMKKGFKSEDIKKRGFFGRMFGGEMKIPPLDKKDERGSLASNRDYLAKTEVRVKKTIEDAAEEEIERKIIEGRARYKGRKQRHTREIIKETAVRYEAEKSEKEVKKETKKPKLEIVSIIGKVRTPEQMREMEKIRKQVETDIEKRKESKKKIEELIKKQKKGQLLTAKEVAYLRAIEFSQKTKKELKEVA